MIEPHKLSHTKQQQKFSKNSYMIEFVGQWFLTTCWKERRGESEIRNIKFITWKRASNCTLMIGTQWILTMKKLLLSQLSLIKAFTWLFPSSVPLQWSTMLMPPLKERSSILLWSCKNWWPFHLIISSHPNTNIISPLKIGWLIFIHNKYRNMHVQHIFYKLKYYIFLVWYKMF